MVPDGWIETTYAHVADINPEALGKSTPADQEIEYLDIGSVDGPGNINGTSVYEFRSAPSRARRKVRSGDTIVSTVRPYLRSFAYMENPSPRMVVSTGFAVVRPADGVHPPFLYQTVLRDEFVDFLVGRQTGSNYPAVGARDVAAAPILLPPLPEQRKIAAILSSVDEVIERTQAVIDQLQIVKKAMMQALLTKGMPGRHTRFKQTEIGEIPEEWEIATYGQLASEAPRSIQSGPFGSALKHSEFVEKGKLVIGIDNVLDGRFSMGANHRIAQGKFDELLRFQARPNDLLITVMATIGRCCVVPDDIEDAIITKHVYRLTADPRKANPYFLMYCVYGIPAASQVVHGSAQGLSRPGLNKSLLLPLPFPIPTLSEQNEIIGILRALDHRIDFERDALEPLAELKTALMSVLLTGQLRVTPDEAAA